MARPRRSRGTPAQAQQPQTQQPQAQAQPQNQAQPQQNQAQANPRPARHISGPQSALTDYLASHNISANRIRLDADQRRAAAARSQQAQQGARDDDGDGDGDGGSNSANGNRGNGNRDDDDGDDDEDGAAGPSTGPTNSRNETPAQKAKRLQKERQAIAKIKASKKFKKRKRMADDSEDDDDIALAILEQMAQPMPGQMDNCDICKKRFTVTPYSKTGPNGGLLCAQCSKDAAAKDKDNKKPRKPAGGTGKRRKIQSNILDGTYHTGAKRLTTLCIETLAKNVDLADSLGELPDHIVDKIARLFSKRRLLNPQTLQLFVQPSTSFLNIYDGAKLLMDDYMGIFQVATKLKEFKARNAIQFKDKVMEYILDRGTVLTSFYLHGANLLSDTLWDRFIEQTREDLATLRVYYTDRHFGDETLSLLAECCPNLTRLKVYHNQKVTDDGVRAIGDIKSLKHLGLDLRNDMSPKAASSTILKVGKNLETLSLRRFFDANDEVLAAIKKSCRSLRKLRITDSHSMTDEGFADLFTNWDNPPIETIDFKKCRHLDSNKPRENESGIGLCSDGFRALMKHSGRKVKNLNVHACRHISRKAFEDVFAKDKQYPELVKLEISFIEEVDDFVVNCIFRSCPNIQEVNVFGCMKVKDAQVPRGKVLVGVPNAVGMVTEGSA